MHRSCPFIASIWKSVFHTILEVVHCRVEPTLELPQAWIAPGLDLPRGKLRAVLPKWKDPVLPLVHIRSEILKSESDTLSVVLKANF